MAEIINNYITNALKYVLCSKCVEHEYQNDEGYKSWTLYLKDFDNYSALTLKKDGKDISELIKGDSIISLLDEKSEIVIELEKIQFNEEMKQTILVPTDKYEDIYKSIEEKKKEYVSSEEAYLIGVFNLKNA